MEESRRSFLRIVSHELRTPLNSIIGFSEIITRELHGPLNEPKYLEHAKIIHESGLRLLKLVNDVIDIARLEAGAMDLDLHPSDPVVAVEEAMRTLASEAAAKRVRLQFSAQDGVRPVLADGRALQTVFGNLIQNAIAHSPDGETVQISMRDAPHEVVVEIKDRGKGVAPADLDRILKPFEQAENALIRRSEGAGLGLAIVGLLCKAMDGKLAVSSSPGEGLTAVVGLPVVSESAAAPYDR
jgi:signal transduction histidine kinase